MRSFSHSFRLLVTCAVVCFVSPLSCTLPIPAPPTCDDIDQCCDPATKPGTGDNPPCFEGVRCCADGQWSCNQGDGSSTCAAPGCECKASSICCDPTSKPGRGGSPICFEGVSCCADGRWSCNAGDGSSTCAAPGTECQGEVCGGVAGVACQGTGDYCQLNEGECCCDFQGLCVPKPDACIEVFDPVCGCDGETYSNSCFAAAAGVNVDHTGACP